MKLIKKYSYIILILLVTGLLLFRLFTNTRYAGHDTIFHTANIVELSKTISPSNIFGSKLITFDSNEYGYGTWLFYPKLPHLSASYLYLIFHNVYTSMNIIYFITMFLSGLVMYLLSEKIFKNKKIAIISSLIYMTVPYHLCEIYIRDAFAENFMFVSSPLIFLGLYYLKDNNYKLFYITFILGYVIGMYSHLISMIFCTTLVAIFIIINYKNFFSYKKIKALLISTLIVTAVTLPFLTTVINYKILNNYTVFLSDTFSNRISVLYSVLNLESYYTQSPINDMIKPYFNISTIVLFIITTVLLIWKKSKYKNTQLLLLFFILILINLMSSKKIWENIPEIFLMIQFPWRLLVFLSLFVSLYAPSCLLTDMNISKKVQNICFCLIALIITVEGLNNISYYSNKQISETEATNSPLAMGYQREYLPVATNEIIKVGKENNTYLEIRKEGILTDSTSAIIKTIENDFPKLVFEITNIDEIATIELPRIYYLGYVLKDESGKKVDLYCNEHGFLEANITKDGKYYLNHTTTLQEKLANIIAIVTIIISISYAAKRWIR